MQSFKDRYGQTWEIEITAGAVRRLKGIAKLDIGDLFENGMKDYGAFIDDPIRRVDALYAICKPQCDAKNINDEQFCEIFDGNAMEDATNAMQEEFIDFFQRSKRPALRKLLQKIKMATEIAEARGVRAVEELDPSILAEKLTASLTNAPELSASTPVHSL